MYIIVYKRIQFFGLDFSLFQIYYSFKLFYYYFILFIYINKNIEFQYNRNYSTTLRTNWKCEEKKSLFLLTKNIWWQYMSKFDIFFLYPIKSSRKADRERCTYIVFRWICYTYTFCLLNIYIIYTTTILTNWKSK